MDFPFIKKKKRPVEVDYSSFELRPKCIGEAITYLSHFFYSNLQREENNFYYDPDKNVLKTYKNGSTIPSKTIKRDDKTLRVDELGEMVNRIHPENKGFDKLKGTLADINVDTIIIGRDWHPYEKMDELHKSDEIFARIISPKYKDINIALKIESDAKQGIYDYNSAFCDIRMNAITYLNEKIRSLDRSGVVMQTFLNELDLDKGYFKSFGGFRIPERVSPDKLKSALDILKTVEFAMSKYIDDKNNSNKNEALSALEKARQVIPTSS